MLSISEHKRDTMIYLDNAATSWPKPETVYQTMGDFLRKKGGNRGREKRKLFQRCELREQAKEGNQDGNNSKSGDASL